MSAPAVARTRVMGILNVTPDSFSDEGELLTESLYRFKGQSAPAVVVCEVDFETLTDQDRRKLFVGLTRAQLRVELVLSAQAVQALMGVLG